MRTFLQKIPAASTTGLDLNHYRAIAGFLDSSGSQVKAEIMQDVRISCVSGEARETLLSSLKNFVSGVTDNGNTLTYMAFSCLDDDVGARIHGRWKTRESFEKFIRKSDINDFWMQNKDYVRAMEQRLYVPNGKGWLHRGKMYAGEGRGAKL